MSWHHFAYLIISLAFLGFGAAGSILTTSTRFSNRSFDESLLAKYALAYCASIMLGFAAATRVRFYAEDIVSYGDYSNIFGLFMLYVIVGVQFFFAGICIGYIISRAGEAVNKVYCADLLGAGIGSLLSIAGINVLGAEATVYAAATASGLAALLFSGKGMRNRLRLVTAAVISLSVLMAAFATRHQIFPVYFPPEKALFRTGMKPHDYRWHVIARIDILDPMRALFDYGGGTVENLFREQAPGSTCFSGWFSANGNNARSRRRCG